MNENIQNMNVLYQFDERLSIINWKIKPAEDGTHLQPAEDGNGQVEGQVNRLKLIKREMYGRANLDWSESASLLQWARREHFTRNAVEPLSHAR